MKNKLLIAFNIEIEQADDIINRLVDGGVEIDGYEIKRSKESVFSALSKPENGFTVVIIQYTLENRSLLSIDDLEKMHTINENIIIIPILPDELENTDYVKDLANIGMYNALFDKDAYTKNFVNIINNGGRSRKDCKKYYNITSAAGVKKNAIEPAIDPVKMLRYIVNENNGSLADRCKYVKERIEPDMFVAILRELPQEMIEELNKIPEYSIYFGANEEKVTSKVIEKEIIKKEVSFVNVNEISGVISLTEKAGSTFTALNLAKQISKLDGITPTFVQLPGTNSDVYERLNFMEVFGADYVSHIKEIADGGNCSNKLNIFSDINFCVCNPYTDMRITDKWQPEMIYKLIVGLSGPIIIDMGKFFDDADYKSLLSAMKNLIVVLDADNINLEKINALIEFINENLQNVKISFVINKCVSKPEYVDIISDKGYDIVIVPKIENKYFRQAGNDIIVTYYKGELLKIAELAGYSYFDIANAITDENSTSDGGLFNKLFKKKKLLLSSDKESGRIKRLLKYNKNERENYNVTVEIGIGGVCRGIGITHSVLLIAATLKEKYRVAVVEQNTTGAFADMYKDMYPEKKYMTVVPAFEHAGITFFPYCNYSHFSSQFRDGFDFVIVDFGDEICTDYYRMQKRLIVASKADWKVKKLKDFVTNILDNDERVDSFNYIVPFADTSELNIIQKKCYIKSTAAGIYTIPYCSNWTEPSKEVAVIMEDILDNIRIERKSSKKLLK